jgi:hypothetical protein
MIVEIYGKVMPYEKARLGPFTISGDPNAPIHVKHDLSKLTDGELASLPELSQSLVAQLDAEPLRRSSRRHQTDLGAKLCQLPRPMMRCGTGLHADQTPQ